MDPEQDTMAAELQALRRENSRLRASSRLKLTDTIQGHLSKFNEDAALDGMFSQDWELRYFILSGVTLRYFTSEREIFYEPRGVLTIPGCTVSLDPGNPPRGPFAFSLFDPEGILLLKLKADSQAEAVRWMIGFRGHGCEVEGLEDLVGGPQTATSDDGAMMAAVAAAARVAGAEVPPAAASAAPSRIALTRLQSERWEKASNPDELMDHEDLESMEDEESEGEVAAEGLGSEPLRVPEDGRFQPQLIMIPTMQASLGVEGLMDPAAAAAAAVPAATAAATAAALASPFAGTPPPEVAAAVPPVPPVSAAVAAATAGEQLVGQQGAVQRQMSRQPSRRPQVSKPGGRRNWTGSSPVHLEVKDSPLSFWSTWTSRHDGVLNLMLVILVASNIRWMLDNLLKYGLRLSLLHLDYLALLKETTSADVAAGAVLLGLWVFPLASLLTERLGLVMLEGEVKAATATAKKAEGDAGLTSKAAVASKGAASLTEVAMACINALNLIICLFLPCGMVYFGTCSPLIGGALTMADIVVWMKLVSYAHCHTSLRAMYRRRQLTQLLGSSSSVPLKPSGGSHSSLKGAGGGLRRAYSATPFRTTQLGRAGSYRASEGCPTVSDPGTAAGGAGAGGDGRLSSAGGSEAPPSGAGGAPLVAYPQNLTLTNLMYYMAAPTLCYQLNFPRREDIRWGRLGQWVVSLVLGIALHLFIIDQYFVPSMTSALQPFKDLNYLQCVASVLKLALPNLYTWVIMFYLLFHVWLNIVGELTRFGDRVFYKTWWNAATLAEYWKLWNVPVHKWMFRTVYFPLVRRKCDRFLASLIVFFLSAVLHEVAVGVPLRMLRGWAFWAMFGQIPLIILTEYLRKRLKSDSLGNIIFWTSFCFLGQPLCVLLYYHDYMLNRLGPEGLQQLAAKSAPRCVNVA